MERRDTKFPCTACGACCTRAGKILDDVGRHGPEHLLHFPYQVDETGRCEKLTTDNKCSVYQDRPLICNIDKFLTLFGLDKQKAYAENIKICNDWMDEDNIPQEYRIKQ